MKIRLEQYGSVLALTAPDTGDLTAVLQEAANLLQLSNKVFQYTLVLNAWPEGRKIYAIKAVRGASGLGLKEAKDLVDQVERQPIGTAVIARCQSLEDVQKMQHKLNEEGLVTSIREDSE